MPSRNRLPNAAELVSRSLNWTRALSTWCERSVMVNAPHAILNAFRLVPAYDEQIIARLCTRVQQQDFLWFPRDAVQRPPTGREVRIRNSFAAIARRQKKSRRFRRLLKLITGRRQTEWTGATRCPNEDDASHKPESLIDRKRAILFRLHLPCRPLAERRSTVKKPRSLVSLPA